MLSACAGGGDPCAVARMAGPEMYRRCDVQFRPIIQAIPSDLFEQLSFTDAWLRPLLNPELFSDGRGTQNDAVKTGWSRYARTVAEGCQLGGLRDKLFALRRPASIKPAAVDAGKGTKVGCAIGFTSAGIQSIQTRREEHLDGQIRALQKSNLDLERYLASMRELVVENNRQTHALQERYTQGRIKLKEKEERLARIRADVKDIDETVAHLRDRRAALEGKLGNRSSTPMTEEQRQKLNQELNRLGNLLRDAEKAAAGIDRAALG
jgi:hypothetical protein